MAVACGLASARPVGTVQLKSVATAVALFELGSPTGTGLLRHIDPVCRMQVCPHEAAATSVVDGTTVYFCSPTLRRPIRSGSRILPDRATRRAVAIPPTV